MKKLKTSNKYVARAEFKRAIADLSKRDDALSRSIVGLHRVMIERFEKMDEKFEKKFDEINQKFNQTNSHIDAFMKRTEDNKLEITLLGRQHDDLAKYCTQKIGYPVYGRNL